MDENTYQKLADDGRQYLDREFKLMKFNLASRLGQLVGLLILAVVVTMLCMLMLVFAGICVAGWLSTYMASYWAYLIVIGVYVLLVVLLIALRNVLLIRPIEHIAAGVVLGQAMKGDISDQMMNLRHESEVHHELVNQDIHAIREDLNRPFGLMSMLHYLPTVFTIGASIWPVLSKLVHHRK